MKEIYYVDGVCGSGKTTAMVELINRHAPLGSKTVIAQPSKLLLRETRPKLRLRTEVFDSDIYAGEVYKQFNMGLDGYGKSDSAIAALTTHNAVLNAPYVEARKNWHLFVDEIPAVDTTIYLNLGETNQWIADKISVMDIGDNLCLKLCIAEGSKTKWQRWKRNPRQDSLIGCQALQSVAALLLNPSYDVFVSRSSWQTRNSSHWQLRIHAVLKPDVFNGWASVRVMGANFPRSMMALLWEQMGVEFKKCPDMAYLQTAHDRQLGERVRVHYFAGRSWSKHVRDLVKSNPFKELSRECQNLFKEKPHLWVANNDVKESEWSAANGIRISNVAHGINEYRNIDNIVFLSALNDQPAHYGFLENKYGVSAAGLKTAKAHETMYQCVMRTSLREKISQEVNVVVPDKEHADFLCHSMFPGAKQFALAEINKAWGTAQATRGRPIKAEKLTASERVERSRKKKATALLTKNALYKELNVNTQNDIGCMTWQQNTYASSDEMLTAPVRNWDKVRELMLEMHALEYRSKEDNSLINFCAFTPLERSDTYKGRQDISYVSALMLDFDGGLLSPEKVSELYSDFKHMVFNSFNNGKEGQWKFRVFIPFDSLCQVDLAESIWDALAMRIDDAGWYVGRDPTESRKANSGLDVSKRPANSFFYTPCQSSQGKKWSFLIDHWDAPILKITVALNWTPFDLQEFELFAPVVNHGPALTNLLSALQNTTPETPAASIRKTEEVVQECIDDYRTINVDGVRRAAFFKSIRRMMAAGACDASILTAMQNMDADQKRRKQAAYTRWLQEAKSWKKMGTSGRYS